MNYGYVLRTAKLIVGGELTYSHDDCIGCEYMNKMTGLHSSEQIGYYNADYLTNWCKRFCPLNHLAFRMGWYGCAHYMLDEVGEWTLERMIWCIDTMLESYENDPFRLCLLKSYARQYMNDREIDQHDFVEIAAGIVAERIIDNNDYDAVYDLLCGKHNMSTVDFACEWLYDFGVSDMETLYNCFDLDM